MTDRHALKPDAPTAEETTEYALFLEHLLDQLAQVAKYKGDTDPHHLDPSILVSMTANFVVGVIRHFNLCPSCMALTISAMMNNAHAQDPFADNEHTFHWDVEMRNLPDELVEAVHRMSTKH